MTWMQRTGLAALCCAGAFFSACAANDSADGAATVDPEAHTGPLCPGCVALQGGETGDFPGGGVASTDPCPPVRRVKTGASSFFSGYPRQSSGFSAQTDVTLQIQVTGVERLDPAAPEDAPSDGYSGYQDVYSPEVRAACDGIELTADVSLLAGDGSINGRLEGAKVYVHSETEARLRVSGDISQFTGSLQIGAREGERLQGSLSVYFNGDRVRGVLTPILKPATETYGYSENGGPTTPEYSPLELHWPGTDRCDSHAFPYTADEARIWAEPTLAMFSHKSTYTGAYFQPTYDVALNPTVLGETQMTLEVASPLSLCEGTYGPSPFRELDFELPAHFVSSDGRYDLFVPLEVPAQVSPAGFGIGTSEFESGALPIEEFRARFGIGPLDFGGAPCASLTVGYDLYLNTEYSRLLEVEAGRCGSGSKLEGAHVVEMLGMTPM
jgi:hypothetical protein